MKHEPTEDGVLAAFAIGEPKSKWEAEAQRLAAELRRTRRALRKTWLRRRDGQKCWCECWYTELGKTHERGCRAVQRVLPEFAK